MNTLGLLFVTQSISLSVQAKSYQTNSTSIMFVSRVIVFVRLNRTITFVRLKKVHKKNYKITKL